MSPMKVGLVLSGGGAKGAYQVGVLKALKELKIEVHAISSASIGALNGAILASADTFDDGIANLEEIWRYLADNSPVEMKYSVYPYFLASAGVRFNPMFAGLLAGLPKATRCLFPEQDCWQPSILSNEPLKKLLDKHLCLDKLSTGVPFYVSVFKSRGLLMDISGILGAEFGIIENPDSEYFHLQSLPLAQQHKMLMASASIPILFSKQGIDDAVYTDGGQGSWSKQHGNTPIQPLIDAGCNMLIVNHLNDGSLWSRHDFPDTTILEIRPQTSLGRDKGTTGAVKDILGFNCEKINSWMEQGYVDAKACVTKVLELSESRHNLKSSKQLLIESDKASEAVDRRLSDSMSALNTMKSKC
ncbi:patatin-like phospholipase family protein [Shewanella sp. S1-49-MNA-CIBAN-0167]|uniref:patatin-like phospholipase family protein n=1 Tax=Shewanella sp. S1-49-MNA-CIBAN-0167 TaxID=3140468 RepID=UPI0033348B97